MRRFNNSSYVYSISSAINSRLVHAPPTCAASLSYDSLKRVSDGRAFAIHDPDIFMEEIAPRFFDKQTHIRSFHRQLSIWGFSRLENGSGGRGVWFHKCFCQDNPELIRRIKRQPVKHIAMMSESKTSSRVRDDNYSDYKIPSKLRKNSKINEPHRQDGFIRELQPKKPSAPRVAAPVPYPTARLVSPTVVAPAARIGVPNSKIPSLVARPVEKAMIRPERIALDRLSQAVSPPASGVTALQARSNLLASLPRTANNAFNMNPFQPPVVSTFPKFIPTSFLHSSSLNSSALDDASKISHSQARKFSRGSTVRPTAPKITREIAHSQARKIVRGPTIRPIAPKSSFQVAIKTKQVSDIEKRSEELLCAQNLFALKNTKKCTPPPPPQRAATVIGNEQFALNQQINMMMAAHNRQGSLFPAIPHLAMHQGMSFY